MRRLTIISACLLFQLSAIHSPASGGAAGLAEAILSSTGVQGGLVVHLNCGDGELTAALRRGDAYLVHGLTRIPLNLARARSNIRGKGLYGPVSVDLLEGKNLPYIANSAGWLMAEVGRQPWIVYEVMLTSQGVSVAVSPGMVLFSLLAFTVVYGVLMGVDVYLLTKYARKGTETASEESSALAAAHSG